MRMPIGIKLILIGVALLAAFLFASRRHTMPATAEISPGTIEGDRLTVTVNGVLFPFRWVPPGTFLMGSSEGEEGRDDAEIRHPVELTKGFWILETEVTQEMFSAVMERNPSEFKGSNLPVDSVTWEEANQFCRKWGETARIPEKSESRLPSEAEWECACRAGTLGPYYGELEEIGWTGEKTEEGATHPVAAKKANDWGIFDMTGNLWEWTNDSWYDYSAEKKVDPRGPENEAVKVDRGGCWDSPKNESRSAYRGVYESDRRSKFVGFRFVILCR